MKFEFTLLTWRISWNTMGEINFWLLSIFWLILRINTIMRIKLWNKSFFAYRLRLTTLGQWKQNKVQELLENWRPTSTAHGKVMKEKMCCLILQVFFMEWKGERSYIWSSSIATEEKLCGTNIAAQHAKPESNHIYWTVGMIVRSFFADTNLQSAEF